MGRTVYSAPINRLQSTGAEQSEARYRDLCLTAFDTLPVSMAVLDAEGTIVAVNREWVRFATENGGSGDGYVGVNYLRVCGEASDTDGQDADGLIRGLLSGERDQGQMEYPCHSPTRNRWFLMKAWRFEEAGELFVAVMHLDITRRRLAEDALRERADRDPLTGLLNRQSFAERGEQALTRARRKGEAVSLLFLDLNKFKSVNDTCGHDTGDRVLEVIAERLAQSVRDTDAPARLGGDEFAVVLEATDGATAAVTAARIKSVMREPIDVDGTTFELSCATGIATARDGQATVDRLLQDADDAMYAEKTS